VNSYPEANYYNLKNKINLIEKKVLSNKVKQSLQNVQKLIDKKETEKAKEVS
jgi:hypothetical protein